MVEMGKVGQIHNLASKLGQFLKTHINFTHVKYIIHCFLITVMGFYKHYHNLILEHFHSALTQDNF